MSRASDLIDLIEKKEKMPLAGHPYHSKTDNELKYIRKDAHDAAKAMRSIGNSDKESKYLDQINDADTVLNYRRNRNG